uniref:Uncharacterized protein n=1 Tax=Pogona vitticeps TaxID=103695 RepID=A0A6J0SK36_9SAUR
MGSGIPYMRLPTSVWDRVEEKMPSLYQILSNVYKTWGKKHVWCGGIIATLFIFLIVSLSWQKPEVHPEPDNNLSERCAQLQREVSGLQATLKKHTEAAEREKAMLKSALSRNRELLQKEKADGEALRAQLVHSNQTEKLLEKTKEEGVQMRAQLEAAHQALSETRKLRDACQDQLAGIAAQAADMQRHEEEKKKLQEEIEHLRQQVSRMADELRDIWTKKANREERIQHLEEQLSRQQRSTEKSEEIPPIVLFLSGFVVCAICKCFCAGNN